MEWDQYIAFGIAWALIAGVCGVVARVMVISYNDGVRENALLTVVILLLAGILAAQIALR